MNGLLFGTTAFDLEPRSKVIYQISKQAGQDTAYSCPRKFSIFSDSLDLYKVYSILGGHSVYLRSKFMAPNENPYTISYMCTISISHNFRNI